MIYFLEYAVFDLVVWQEEEKNEENKRGEKKKCMCSTTLMKIKFQL